jgi:uncharacterized repeat protein (TIGR03803 family)
MAFLIMASASLVGAQTLQTLCSFNNANGAFPYAGLTLGSDGNFYGTTGEGDSGIYGTVFKVTTNGTLTTLVYFYGTNGAFPRAALTLGNDGNFYGTTSGGGSSNCGTVFKVTTNGTLTTLVSFSGTNGWGPRAALTLGNDGNFYGTTGEGGKTHSEYSSGMGTVFKVTTNGTLTTLVFFNFYYNGVNPEAALTLGNDGNFYGTTSGGRDYGTVFKVTTNGTLTTLVYFYNANGAYPYAGLTLGNDGNFYGTTAQGGSGIYGTVFRLLLPPAITVQPQSQTNNAGATVTFLVNATSLHPMTFQWQKNGTNLVDGGNLSGAASDTLTIRSISDSDAATYSVIVSNANFSVTNYATLTVINPPIITAQPVNLVVLPGTNVAFGVSLTGTAPLRYQWLFNGTNILKATNAIYTILSVGTNKAGDYAVVITNAAGSATSSNAVLSVVLSPTSRTNYASSTASFTATAFGPESLNYQWQENGTNLANGGNISGATNSTLTIANVSDADAANYCAVVSDAYSSVTTSNATLAVINPPIITAQPVNLVVLPGTNVAFGVSLTGTAPLRYQWLFNGANILNATNAIYTILSVGTNKAGNYAVVITNAVGSTTSSNAVLSVVLSPTSRTNYASSTATFTATAFGPESLNYQWQKNGTNLVNGGNISGATNSTLIIANVSDADATSYCAVVSDDYSSVTTSNATLTVKNMPLIASQPKSQTVLAGSNVTFDVTAYGAPPFVFQWRFKGTSLGPPAVGTSLSSCTLTNVGTNQAGNYSVQVVNGYGSVTSSNAMLTVVTLPPTITTQPTNRTNNAATIATFSVVASGSSPLSYQWQKNGTNVVNGGKISGATNSTLTIVNVSSNDAAIYSVSVTNLAGSATSSNATLTVIYPLKLALQLVAGYPLLNLTGILSNNYVVQYSTNLADTNWINLLSLTNLSVNPYQFLDVPGAGQPSRFYRAFMQ